ncbi:hypothetical protein C5B42_00305 [Candidatus Cerribacteria bacterium 'Amazon FNV 2010 28 9']|uniref:Glycosyltransferase 2-like domain-containing protein n=1 Tax=Candidatus Cerribacteria bacterium 'Amazon FNV 2010 28 9' TaxID=2081795 RepID=A0A317JQI4_9BACT|nr:MAG: hypothetical protein C5B42_00305 [Candidatus Cerribacteria bacterium 'Amazon FNV 2010 28 9']
MTLSIIIVDYKAKERVNRLVSSLHHPDWEVIVVDNTIHNRGYGGGCNEGASKAKGEFLLFLNPDIVVTAHAIEQLIRYVKQHPDVAAVGPQMCDEQGIVGISSLGKINWWSAFVGFSFLKNILSKDTATQRLWLSDWKRDTTRDVESINGACLCVRVSDFQAVGGFDESYFLYWEENDICARLRATGKRIVFCAEVSVRHSRELSMQQGSFDRENVFRASRSLFFAKQFGFLKGLLLSWWLWFNEEWRMLILCLCALFIRLALIDHISLIGDVGRDYLQAVALLQGKAFPLLGIPSSVPRFAQGPFNIWFAALSFKLLGISPFSPVIVSGLLTTLIAVMLFRLLKRETSKHAAFYATLLFVFSPAAIAQARMPFYLFAIPLFVLFFFNSLLALDKKSIYPSWGAESKNARIFLVVFSFFLLFQWELATIPFAVLLLIAMCKNKINILSHWKTIGSALILGLLPQFLFDLTHRCQQLCQFVVWMGYRTIAVTGVDHRHSLTVLHFSFWNAIALQFSRLIGFGMLPSLITTLFFLIGVGTYIKRKKIPTLLFYTLFAIFFLFVGLVIHGDPSEAYFPSFLPLLSILFSYTVVIFHKKIQVFIFLVVVGICIWNTFVLLKNTYFLPSIQDDLAAAKWIHQDSQKRAIILTSTDQGSMFSTYLDGLQFLLQMKGRQVEQPPLRYRVSLDGELHSSNEHRFGPIEIERESRL